MEHVPYIGKTYTLQDERGSSAAYFHRIGSIAGNVLHNERDLPVLLSIVRRLSHDKRRLRTYALPTSDVTIESHLLDVLCHECSRYVGNVSEHLRGLSVLHKWGSSLATEERQYFLYMLEIELTNRLNVGAFRQSGVRLAFLPHCLHDLDAECRRTFRGEDYVCKGCSPTCSINAVTKLLRRHGVQPYIWITANLKSLLRRLRKQGKSVGVVGVACIPELVRGMRQCQKAGVPVVGVPLDANRCARWWGEFKPNAVNLDELASVLGAETLLHGGRRRPPLASKSES